jgi:nucleoside-diphosphate-sugar epimerase
MTAGPLTVAVTGPTGTFGFGLMPLLQADDRIGRVVGIARRPFDPAQRGWSKMEYRQGDVRDRAALERAFRGADVVVHLAFAIVGNAPSSTIHAINVEGTLHAFHAAAAAGAKRFVYASSVAAYGFHPDNPVPMTERWPTRPAARLSYARQKADLEQLLSTAAATHPELDLYVLRPPVVLGPHTVGAKQLLPDLLAQIGRGLARRLGRLPVPVPVFVPGLPLQFVHEDDVGQAFVLCIVGAGPAGAYNIAGDGVVTLADVARELGALPLPVPAQFAQAAARAVSALPSLPYAPPITQWAEAASHPAIVDTTKAKHELGWQPRYSSIEALRTTIRNGLMS